MKETEDKHTSHPLWLAYTAPIAAFIVLTSVEGYVPQAGYVWFYLIKAIAVTATLVVFRAPWKDIRPTARVLVPAILVGLVVFAEWILLDQWIPYPHLGSRVGFNPFDAIESPALRVLFLTVRFYSLVLMVPVMEELFWRSFLLRYFTDSDFARLPVGSFSWGAFAIVSGLFALAHAEWLVAFICACIYALLLRQTKSIFACILAHSTTNLALGIYVILARDWIYW